MDQERILHEIHATLVGNGVKPVMYTDDGKETVVPDDAKYFFSSDPNLMISVDFETNSLRFHKGKSVDFDSIKQLHHQIKKIANNNLLNFEFKVFGTNIVPNKYAHEAANHLTEGFSPLTGTQKTSYQNLGDVKLVIKHKYPVTEIRGSRSRNIKEIYVEHNNVRHKLPFVLLSGARAVARHLYEGGSIDDNFGKHLISMCEKYIKLKEFVRYAKRNKLINEDTRSIVEVIKENLKKLRKDITKSSSPLGYKMLAARLQEVNACDEADDIEPVKDMFTVKKFDNKFEEILPEVKTMINKHEDYLRKIEEASTMPIYLEKAGTGSLPATFKNKNEAKATKLSMLAASIKCNEQLAEYVIKLSKKISEGQDLTEFESNIVKNVLVNATFEEVKTSSLTESKDYKKLEKIEEEYKRELQKYDII